MATIRPEMPWIAEACHFRAENAAFHRGVGYRRARHAAHQRGHQTGDLTDIAVHVAGTGVAELEETLGDAAGIHQVSCQDKQRNRQHGEALRSGNGLLHQNGHGQVSDQEKRKARKADGESHRHTRQQQNKKNNDRNIHQPISLAFSALTACPAGVLIRFTRLMAVEMIIRNEPTGTASVTQP